MPNAINQTIGESCDAEAMFTADIAKSTADMAAASTHLVERFWFQRHARDCEVEPCKKRFSTCKKTDQESILSKFKIAR